MVELEYAAVGLAVMRRAWLAHLVRARARLSFGFGFGFGLGSKLGLDRGERTMPHVVQTLSSNSTPLMSCVRRTVSSGTRPSTLRGITPGSEAAPTAMARETRTQRRMPKTSTAGDE